MDLSSTVSDLYSSTKLLISEHKIETGILGLDTIATGVFAGRELLGNIEQSSKLAQFLFSNGFPHTVLGAAPVITGYYIIDKLYERPYLGMAIGGLVSSVAFYREYLEAAYDSLSDSGWSLAGILLGVAVSLYIKKKTKT